MKMVFLVIRWYPGKVLRDLVVSENYSDAIVRVGNDCMKVEVVEVGSLRDVLEDLLKQTRELR